MAQFFMAQNLCPQAQEERYRTLLSCPCWIRRYTSRPFQSRSMLNLAFLKEEAKYSSPFIPWDWHIIAIQPVSDECLTLNLV